MTTLPDIEIRPAMQAAERQAGREPAGPRAHPPRRAGRCRIAAAIRRFEASRAADVIGAGIVGWAVVQRDPGTGRASGRNP